MNSAPLTNRSRNRPKTIQTGLHQRLPVGCGLLLLALVTSAGCQTSTPAGHDIAAVNAGEVRVASPNGRIVIDVNAAAGDDVSYRVQSEDRTVVDASPLGLTFADSAFGPARLVDARRSSRDETYTLPVGKTSRVRDHANAATLMLEEVAGRHRRLEIEVRAYDDGVAFRYRIPEQPNLGDVAITGESTGFALAPQSKAWVLPLPGLNDHYEYYYDASTLSAVKPTQLVGLPLLMQLPDGHWAAITEANLTDYAGMGLMPDPKRPGAFNATLAPPLDRSPIKVRGHTPFVTPWRVVMIGDAPGRLIESNLVTNLNEPCAIADTAWIKPGKVSFLWWNGFVKGVDAAGKPIEGDIDTETCIKYVDFAADNGIPYASLDGVRDQAWYGGPLQYKDQDLTTGHAKNLDVQAVLAHAKARGVRMRLWMDSKALWPQLDKALDAFERWGVEGLMIDFVEREDQQNVLFFEEVVRKAAAHHLTITIHNVPKPTGLSRTWPNLLTFEAVRNEEYNKWSPGATPAHQVTVPFTRMLAGPLDFHSGGFRSVLPKDFKPVDLAPVVMGTRAHQVAMYVVYEDPMPMVVDFLEAYRGQPGFEMLVNIPTTWDETRVLAGEVGKFITIARHKGEVWYVGSMNGDEARTYEVPLSFLGKGRFAMTGWCDGAADRPNEPVAERPRDVTRGDALKIKMSPAGGHIARLTLVH